jgi:tripartite-type tricarboxylate transporter receptor subunit TctC
MSFKHLLLGLLAAAAFAIPAISHAAEWPAKPIQIIVPFPPGNDPSTIILNAMGPLMQKELGQPIKVINKPGGGGVLGGKDLATARPDGYTFGVMAVGPMVSQVVMGKTPYQAADFKALGMCWSTPFVLAVKGDAPYNNLKELADYAKEHPGLKLGHWGLGAVPTVIAMNIAKIGGFTWQETGYQDLNALLLTQGTADAITVSTPYIRDYTEKGEVKPLAALLPVRLPAYPHVPTVAEQGYGNAYSVWFGLFAPSKVKPEIMEKFRSVFFKVMQAPAVQEAITKTGVVAHPSSAEDAQAQVIRELKEYDVILRDVGIKK